MQKPLRQWIKLVEGTLPETVRLRAARRLIDYIDWSGGSGETVLIHLGYDNLDAEPVDRGSAAFKRRLKAWAIERVTSAFEEIDWRFNGGRIRVYRMITAPRDYQPDPNRHPGEFWSWDVKSAEAHWGNFGGDQVNWLLVADVSRAQIDWEKTLAANGLPDYESEREINVRSDTQINLLSYKQVK